MTTRTFGERAFLLTLALILGLCLLGAAYVAGGRYETVTVPGAVIRNDRLNGEVVIFTQGTAHRALAPGAGPKPWSAADVNAAPSR